MVVRVRGITGEAEEDVYRSTAEGSVVLKVTIRLPRCLAMSALEGPSLSTWPLP